MTKNTDLRIIITGSSDGIGKTLARAFARRGAKLGLIARRKELLEELAKELKQLGSPQVEWAAVDVTDSAAQRAALEKIDATLGGATHFIANAGVSGRSHPEKDSYAEAKKCLDVNVNAAIDGIEFMKAKMVARGTGFLIGVSSVAGTRGLPDSGVYSASKAALTVYLESLRVDVRPYGVKVLTIAPGFISTALTAQNKGKLPFIISAEKAGEIFARAVLREKRFIVAPWQFSFLIVLMRWMPDCLYDWIMGRVMGSFRGPRQIRASS